MDEVLHLLRQVIEENKALKEEVKSLHEKFDAFTQNKPRKTKTTVVVNERDQCSGLTAKGTRCKNLCVENGKCRMHINQSEEAAQPKPKKQKKVKEPAPRHTHAPGEQPEVYCKLCETHGDILDPELPERDFEIVVEHAEHTEEFVDDEVEDDEVEDDEDPFIGKLSSLLIQNNTDWADDDDDFFKQ